MRLELAVAKRERDFYLQKVEQAKQIEKMAERRAAEAAESATTPSPAPRACAFAVWWCVASATNAPRSATAPRTSVNARPTEEAW